MVTKIVVDTNNLISALGWNGKSRLLFHRIIDGEYSLYLSTQQLVELKRVMDYRKFGFSDVQKNKFLEILFHVANIVHTKISLDVVDDKDDNKILECAVEVNADYVISGDDDLLRIREFKNIKIVNVDEFLKNN